MLEFPKHVAAGPIGTVPALFDVFIGAALVLLRAARAGREICHKHRRCSPPHPVAPAVPSALAVMDAQTRY